jgi:hypothetical protein
MKRVWHVSFLLLLNSILWFGCANDIIDVPNGDEDGDTWIIETVGAVEEDDETSLVLDSNGFPHISYSHVGNLEYAYKDENGWHTEVADYSNYVGADSSIALDSNDNPHISYYDYYSNEDLKYAYHDGSRWYVETVYDSGNAGRSTCIALDENENPCICFVSGYSSVDYAYHDGSSWHFEDVGTGEEAEMVFDDNYYPHVAYSHYDTTQEKHYLKYAYKDAGGWNSEIMLDTGSSVDYPSIDLDSHGHPHIMYYYREDPAYENQLQYAYNDGSTWHIESVSDENGAYYISLEVDNSDYPHAAFYYWGYSSLKYLYLDENGWYSETIEDFNDIDIEVGMYPSLVLDSNGLPHISYTYYDDANLDRDLKYARYSP